MRNYDLVVIGAGPAGMAAATTAASQGLKVALVDEQRQAGGQIYRNIGSPVLSDERVLGPDYYYGRELARKFSEANVDYLTNATVWEVSKNHLCLSIDGESQRIGFTRVLIATGAQERPVPFPGWTTPGVMTCGAAQIMLKTSGLAPSGPLVIAGSGPLLLLVACQLSRAGIEIAALLDTTPKENYRAALKHLPGALRGWRYLLKGTRLIAELRRKGVKPLNGVSQLNAIADENGKLTSVRFRHNGTEQTVACSSLLVHQGVVPNVQLTRSLGAEHSWDELQQCWRPTLDEFGETSIPNIYVAGDNAGIGGALVAELQGQLVATRIAMQAGQLSAEAFAQMSSALQTQIEQQLAIRPFLDQLYTPAPEFLRPSDETVVCRCEEVTAGEIRNLAKTGCAGPNQAKAFSRAGMGPCQGRLCGLTVSQLMAEASDRPVPEVGYYNVRSPIKPVTLAEVAGVHQATESLQADS